MVPEAARPSKALRLVRAFGARGDDRRARQGARIAPAICATVGRSRRRRRSRRNARAGRVALVRIDRASRGRGALFPWGGDPGGRAHHRAYRREGVRPRLGRPARRADPRGAPVRPHARDPELLATSPARCRRRSRLPGHESGRRPRARRTCRRARSGWRRTGVADRPAPPWLMPPSTTWGRLASVEAPILPWLGGPLRLTGTPFQCPLVAIWTPCCRPPMLAEPHSSA